MTIKSRRLVTEKLKSLENSSYIELFKGVTSYRRVNLTEFVALNMLTVVERVVDIDILILYLPSIFYGIVDTDILKRMIYEDDAWIIADFVEGEIYRKKQPNMKYVDYYSMALDEKKREQKNDKTIADKVSRLTNKSLDEIYAEKKVEITDYLSSTAVKMSHISDEYKTHEEPTISSVLQQTMDKNPEVYNGVLR